VASDLGSASSNFLAGYRAVDAGDFDSAIDYYTYAIRIDESGDCGTGTIGKAYNERGYAYFRETKFAEALKDVDLAISKNPKFVAAYLTKNSILVGENKYQDSLTNLNTVIGLLGPVEESGVCYILRGRTEQELKMPDRAIQDYSQGVSLLDGKGKWQSLVDFAKKQIAELGGKS